MLLQDVSWLQSEVTQEVVPVVGSLKRFIHEIAPTYSDMPKNAANLGKLLNGTLKSHGKPVQAFGKHKWRPVHLSLAEARVRLQLAASAVAAAAASASASFPSAAAAATAAPAAVTVIVATAAVTTTASAAAAVSSVAAAFSGALSAAAPVEAAIGSIDDGSDAAATATAPLEDADAVSAPGPTATQAHADLLDDEPAGGSKYAHSEISAADTLPTDEMMSEMLEESRHIEAALMLEYEARCRCLWLP